MFSLFLLFVLVPLQFDVPFLNIIILRVELEDNTEFPFHSEIVRLGIFYDRY